MQKGGKDLLYLNGKLLHPHHYTCHINHFNCPINKHVGVVYRHVLHLESGIVLTGTSIKVFSMTKEEGHQREKKNLVQLMELPLMSLLTMILATS
jgi:hypothetical protein